MSDTTTSHGADRAERERVAVEQFTVHAGSFASSPVINDERALQVLGEVAEVRADDVVADVACGPGIVATWLAARTSEVVGVDLTPTMVALATERADAAGVAGRARFVLGSMDDVPLPTGGFSLVVSRYAMHHAPDPAQAMAELARLCAPGGRIVIVDFAADPDPAVARRYDDAERLRDPSHVANLTRDAQVALLEGVGFQVRREGAYRVEADLERVLAGSHGTDHDGVRRAFEASIDGDGLGVGAHRQDGRIRFAYPISVLAAFRA
jgi:SAM-dependent methyltransferase